ncbi:hypothetical protein [Curvibacter sp. PAE-UM]|uniref:hypothetical protein n=1 Tax=Curvibacter sp. PAE-UM TaxID=1714344 RepID=UPI0012E37C6F|nr:hypothetical protein [Curvibacter sp. PAE-UM]
MATIGAKLPPQILRERIVQRLKPGAVIKLNARMNDGNVKEKRYVVLSVTAKTVCCVVNSEKNAFVQARPTLARHHVPMDASSHVFMDHDSFVDCTQTKTFETSQVVSDLMERTEWMLGAISLELRDRIVTSLTTSSTIAPNLTQPLCNELAKLS